jgi:hypothetical protein
MKVGARLALGVAIGYCLGRTKKMRVALTLVAAGATGRMSANPGDLVKQGAKLLDASPELRKATEDMRGRLVDAGKAAAIAAASNRIGSLTDRLHERADLVRNPELLGGSESDDAEESGEDSEDAAPRRRSRRQSRGSRDSDEDSRADSEEDAGEDSGEDSGQDDELEDYDEDEEYEEPRRSTRTTSTARRSPVRRTRR